MNKPEAETQRAKFKFRIWHVFFVTAFYATGMALMPLSALLTTVVLAACYFGAFTTVAMRAKIFKWISGLAVLIVLVALLLPTVSVRGTHPPRISCMNNQRQLMLALFNYESAHLKFPDACQTDKDGKPMHSWRVMILPYMEANDVYEAYDFSEPWDGPNNSLLANKMPYCFQCPSHVHKTKTHYKLITGPGSLFGGNGGNGRSLGLIEDGTSNTVALIEDPGHPVNWMKPEDISIDQVIEMYRNLPPEDLPHLEETDSMFWRQYSGSSIARYDGSTGILGVDVDPEELRKSLVINDGTPSESFWKSRSTTETKWGNVGLAMAYILMLIAVVNRSLHHQVNSVEIKPQ